MLQKERATWAEDTARERVAETISYLARQVEICSDLGQWERAERMAKILAILLASRPN